MKGIAVHLLAVATRRQLRRRTPFPSRPSHEPLIRTSCRNTSTPKEMRRKLSSNPSKVVSAIASATRLSRLWRRKDGRHSVHECEGADQAEATETATTADTLRDVMSEEDVFGYLNPPNSPVTSSVDIKLEPLSSPEVPASSSQSLIPVRPNATSLLHKSIGHGSVDVRARSPTTYKTFNAPLYRACSLPTTTLAESPLLNFFSSLGSLASLCVPSTSHKSLVSSATVLSLSEAGDYLLEPRLPPSPTGMFAKLALPVVGIFSGSASPAASIVSVLPSPWSLMTVPEAIPLLEVQHLVRDAVSLLPVESR